jgi:hypothetical protein
MEGRRNGQLILGQADNQCLEREGHTDTHRMERGRHAATD